MSGPPEDLIGHVTASGWTRDEEWCDAPLDVRVRARFGAVCLDPGSGLVNGQDELWLDAAAAQQLAALLTSAVARLGDRRHVKVAVG